MFDFPSVVENQIHHNFITICVKNSISSQKHHNFQNCTTYPWRSRRRESAQTIQPSTLQWLMNQISHKTSPLHRPHWCNFGLLLEYFFLAFQLQTPSFYLLAVIFLPQNISAKVLSDCRFRASDLFHPVHPVHPVFRIRVFSIFRGLHSSPALTPASKPLSSSL